MRKFITLLVLAIFVFNVMGYYGVYLGLRYQSNRHLKAQLDSGNYDKRETLTIKVPYLLPYQSESAEFIRVDGEFEKDGEFYKLVKHKVESDTLFIVYIKDQKETNLFNFVTAFVAANSDTPASKTALKLMESFVKDYIQCTSTLQVATSGWCVCETFSARHTPSLIVRDTPVFSPPPNFI